MDIYLGEISLVFQANPSTDNGDPICTKDNLSYDKLHDHLYMIININ